MTTYRTTKDIIIPAGTELVRAADQRGGRGYVEAVVGHGRDFTSTWVVQAHPDALASGEFEEVSP
jgi:hypothetical protein